MTAERSPEPDPQVEQFLQLYDSMDVPELHELSPPEAREVQEQLSQADPDIDLPTVEDRTIDGPDGEIPIRLYDPRTEETETPLILFYHGGGFVVGSLDTHDGPCRKLAAETGYPVVSVDYRLAPEHPFPAGLNDCYAALEWASETDELGIDSGQIVVAGDSAGGNFAAAVSLLSRDRDGPEIAAQVLVYPVTGDAAETDSYDQNGEGYFLTTETMEWFHDQYLDDPIDEGNIYVAPRLAADLSDLPPATVVTAGYDPLRDDGALYAERLRDAGVEVSHHNFGGMIHGFFNMIADPVDIDAAHEAYDAVVADLDGMLDD
ncbi:alpha/beta hydrolase fold domain-containing protein [Halovenus sp. WSH3]|uniref:Alpha/beta hydrolase fold domain-containing protein n=1 Tax=Halovenus carboxidivorans TaxID=2692199 RepID=A0A6B0T6B0_9EURY|nr:alpha/beta hydrolase fold domain-containing protein [Halovenus carboxidivorans]